MLIDWFTVAAQAVNFLVLVWLMKRFLYKPILLAIDAREERIALEIADADAKQAEAKKAGDNFLTKNESFDSERASLLTKAVDEANAERQRLLSLAAKAADDLSAKRRESLKSAAARLHEAIGQRTRDEVFAISRKALVDLANASLELQMAEVFIRRLSEIDDESKEILGGALKSATEPAVVRSAFDLAPEQCAAIRTAINETFSAEISVQFDTAPDLVCGIELTGNGQKVSWSISNYLADLEKSVGEVLTKETASQPTVAKASA
jgi:F-type H+-transporting ATPase subunit b